MPTLADEIDRIQADLGRGTDAEVRREILSTIAEHEREMHHFAERRLGIIELATGQQWYSTIGFRSPSIYSTAQIEAFQDIPDLDLEWSFDDFPWVGTVGRVLKVQYVRLEEVDRSQGWRMDWLDYPTFEHYSEPPLNNSQPHIWTMSSHQIGVYPPPDQAYGLRLSVWCKPLSLLTTSAQAVDANDGMESIYFVEAEELIRTGAKMRLCGLWRDVEGYQMYEAQEQAALRRLRAENVRRSSGVIRPHGPC